MNEELAVFSTGFNMVQPVRLVAAATQAWCRASMGRHHVQNSTETELSLPLLSTLPVYILCSSKNARPTYTLTNLLGFRTVGHTLCSHGVTETKCKGETGES